MNTNDKNIASTQKKEGRITEKDKEIIRGLFKDEQVLKVLRKFMLPEISGEDPIGHVVDLYMQIPVDQMTQEQAYHNLMARNLVIKHIESQLLQLYVIANENIRKA